MRSFLRSWDLMRILRMKLGVFIVMQGIQAGEWLLVIMGALFSLMPLLNIGCCSTAGCHTPLSQKQQKAEEITFEEIR